MEFIEGGICAAKGFRASGMHCGIRKTKASNKENPKNDICIFVSDCLCNTAAVYTQNKVQGAPITVCKNNMQASENKSIAVIANSKNANTCNKDGVEVADKMCQLLSDELECKKEQIIVASTGVIGQPLPIEPVKNAVGPLVSKLDYKGNVEAATAIMTTDTFKKECAVQFKLGDKLCHIGGMGKGSGMINPNMATTLNFITTDCAISTNLLQAALNEVVEITYNCLSVDGDTSTNDMVSVMANGLANNTEITSKNDNYNTFKQALYEVMASITKMIAKDGEGATKLLEVKCSGAPDKQTAIRVSKSVVSSNLLKAAMFGQDANWGRILSAIGNTPGKFDISKICVSLESEYGSVDVCVDGFGCNFDEDVASNVLSSDEIIININMNQGSFDAKAWGCDLTYEYVKINGDYRT